MNRYIFLERFYAACIVLFAIFIILAFVGRDVGGTKATVFIVLAWVSGILAGMDMQKNRHEAERAAIDEWLEAEKEGPTARIQAQVRDWLEEHPLVEDAHDAN